MKKLALLFALLVCIKVYTQELKTSKAIETVIRPIHWKKVKKVKVGQGRQDWYLKDKNSNVNYWYRINRNEEVTEYVYYNDQLILIKHYAKGLPGENVSNLSTFFIYKDEVIDKFTRGREVLPSPLINFAKQYKEEAKKIIFQSE